MRRQIASLRVLFKLHFFVIATQIQKKTKNTKYAMQKKKKIKIKNTKN